MTGPHDNPAATLHPMRSATPAWPSMLAVVIVALPCVAVSQFIVHYDDAILDDHLFAYYGWCIQQGAVLYRDIWDHKPPGTIWLNAAGYFLSGGRYAGVVAICVTAQLAALAAFGIAAAKLHHRSTAALLTALAAVYLTHSHFFGGSNRGESYIVAFDLLMLVCYLAGWQHSRWGWWVAAGAFGGAAVLMKQSGIAAPAAFMLHLLALGLAGRIDHRTAARRIVLLLIGMAFVLLPTTAVLAWQGPLTEAWRAVVTFNRSFVGIESVGPDDSAWWWTRLDRSGLPMLKLPLLLAAASLLLAISEYVQRRKSPATQLSTSPLGEALTLWLLLLWLCASMAAAIAGPTPSTHYMLPVLPPLLLLGGRFLDAILAEAALLARIAQRASVIIALFAIAYLATDAILAQAQKASMVHWSRMPVRQGLSLSVEPTAAEEVGRIIRARTHDDDTLLCWDYLPAVMLEARRKPATRFPSHRLFTIASRADICEPDEYFKAIVSRSPTVIVVSSQSRRRLEREAGDPTDEFHAEARAIMSRYTYHPEFTHENIELFWLSESPAP